MRAAMHLGTRYTPSERTRRGGRLEYRHAYTRAVDMPSAMPIRAVPLKNYNISGHRSASRKHSLPVHRHVYRPVILDRRPFCTDGHFAQTAILHILRMWPYCTEGKSGSMHIRHKGGFVHLVRFGYHIYNFWGVLLAMAKEGGPLSS